MSGNGLDRPPYLRQKFASQDKRFQAALAEADALFHLNHGARGAEFEEDVRSLLARFLPYTYQVHGGFMPAVAGQNDLTKQLDVVIRSRFLPELLHAVPVELITIAGEVKTMFGDRSEADYLATSEILARGATLAGRRRPLPFFALAGAMKWVPENHAAKMASVVRGAAAIVPDGAELCPAFFSFDNRGAMSVLQVGPSAPMSAVTEDGEELSGVISIAAPHLSASAACYLWVWACLYTLESEPGMEMRYMRDTLYGELTAGHGLPAAYWPSAGNSASRPVTAFLRFAGEAGAHAAGPDPGQPPLRSVSDVIRESAASPGDQAGPPPEDEPTVAEPGSRRFILITLGRWVDEPDTWDESLWGGSGTASRRGYGYYEGMSDRELLDASRLFWRFKADSGNWDGIDYGVVAHAGRIRAVIRITGIIGPLWGRYGFQGHLVKDSELARELIGQSVPTRQNPVTTVEL